MTDSSRSDLRLILLGTISCGKTLTADTLLGQRSSHASPPSPRECQLRQGVAEGRSLSLVEAPRWYWSGGQVEASIRQETERALSLVAPGPHAFLLLVPVGQFTEVEQKVPKQLEEMFGEGVLRHTLVVLTCGDYLCGQTMEGYLAQEDQGLREVVQRCGGNCHVINNRLPHEREQVATLLEKVERMAVKNSGCYVQGAAEMEVGERLSTLRARYRSAEERPEQRPRVEVRTMETQRNGETEKTRETRETRETKETRETRETEETREPREMRETREIREIKGSYATDDRREELNETVTVKRRANGLHSQLLQQPQEQLQYQPVIDRARAETRNGTDNQLGGSSPFNPPEEGAILTSTSQQSENRPTQSFLSAYSLQTSAGTGPTVRSSSSSFSSSSASTVSGSSSSEGEELRLVLLGRSGSGKSSSGNTILGREQFASRSEAAVTQKCEKAKAYAGSRRVAVVDTPDWFCSESTPEEVRAQLSSCVALSAPGPHAFLLCIPVNQPANLEVQALSSLEQVFGPDSIRRHTLVLFTHVDLLEEGSAVEKHISSKHPEMLKIVEKCGDRYHVLERGLGSSGSVEQLMEKVEHAVKESGGAHYSCPLYEHAESRVRQRQEEIARERRREVALRVREQYQVDRSAPLSALAEVEEEEVEEVQKEELEQVREEAEKSVRLEDSVPALSSPSSTAGSLLRSAMEVVGEGAKRVPKLVAGGALVGGVLGAFWGGPMGAAIGAATGSVVTEVGRRKYSKTKTE